jgi:DNA polymerase III subunit alpha
MSQCVHLHCHSAYSFYDGLATVDELVGKAAMLGQPGIALTDHGNAFGAAAFFSACDKHGIQGMIGMEAYEAVPHSFDMERDGKIFNVKWADLNGQDRYYHITLWVKDAVGWGNLCRLHSQSFSADYFPSQRGKPLIDRASLERYNEGLMIGLGCAASRTNRALARGEDPYGHARWYADVFGDRAYVEVMANLQEQQALLRDQRKLAQRLGLSVVATNDVHYVDRADGRERGPHHTLVQARFHRKSQEAEQSGDKSDAGFGQWYGSDGFYLKSYDEFLDTGGLMPDEIDRTVEVWDRADFHLKQVVSPKPPVAPVPQIGEDRDFDAYLRDRGLLDKLAQV